MYKSDRANCLKGLISPPFRPRGKSRSARQSQCASCRPRVIKAENFRRITHAVPADLPASIIKQIFAQIYASAARVGDNLPCLTIRRKRVNFICSAASMGKSIVHLPFENQSELLPNRSSYRRFADGRRTIPFPRLFPPDF